MNFLKKLFKRKSKRRYNNVVEEDLKVYIPEMIFGQLIEEVKEEVIEEVEKVEKDVEKVEKDVEKVEKEVKKEVEKVVAKVVAKVVKKKKPKSLIPFIPAEIENIILDYTKQFNKIELIRRWIIKQKLPVYIYFYKLNSIGYSNDLYYYINQMRKKLDSYTIINELTFDEIYRIFIGTINLEMLSQNEYTERYGYKKKGYTRIEDLPRDLIDETKNVLYWGNVGDGSTFNSKGYTRIEDLPRDFVERYKDYINWDYVGSGYQLEEGMDYKHCKNYSKIEDLPRDFVEQFKDYINWDYVGGGEMEGINYEQNLNYSKIEDLPRDFVEQFKDYINLNKFRKYSFY